MGNLAFSAAALAESPASFWISHCHKNVAVKVCVSDKRGAFYTRGLVPR
jgi:hypothetical protein